MDFTYPALAKMVDHSLLQPYLSVADLEQGCRLAMAYEVASVCLLPYFLPRCAELLRGTGVKASTTIGFPHGAHRTSTKLAEVQQALADGGEELDLVVNISQVLSSNWEYVRSEIAQCVACVHDSGQRIKVIFENCYLNEQQKIALCAICGELNVDWVKTSTGYGTSGATLDDVRLLRLHSPPHVQVKAAGGVRDLAALLEVREAGASRCGTSKTKEILDEARRLLHLPPFHTPGATASDY